MFALRIESRAVLTEDRIRGLLAPFGVLLTSDQISQLNDYLELLLAWNKRINLTSVFTPEECVTRHFGESLYISSKHAIGGRLIDVGSGAGFPGLALEIVFPDLHETLLEPIAKKRAFLKEVARTCGFSSVEIRPERLDAYISSNPQSRFDVATSRAVGDLHVVCRQMASCMKVGGKMFLWISGDSSVDVTSHTPEVDWTEALPIPLSRKRIILCGVVRKAKG